MKGTGAAPLTVVVVAGDHEPAVVASALESVTSQVEGSQVGGAQVVLAAASARRAALADELEPFAGRYEPFDTTGLAPGEARNAALAEARAPIVLVVEGGERVGAGALERHLATLGAEPQLIASYGRTAVQETQRTRIRPDRGRGGVIFERLLRDKTLVASSACIAWRRDVLGAAPYGEFQTQPALLVDLLLRRARGGEEFLFHPAVVAERQERRPELIELEELVKVFLGVLYGPDPLDEQLAQRARFRLARHCVAVGKHHYRAGDYDKAGKFFDQALKAAPDYFKGWRYQFFNFFKKKTSG